MIIIKYVVRYVFDREYFTSMSQLAYDLNRPSKEYSSAFSPKKHNFFNRDTRVYSRLKKEYVFRTMSIVLMIMSRGKTFMITQFIIIRIYRMMYDGNFYKYSDNYTRNHINYREIQSLETTIDILHHQI